MQQSPNTSASSWMEIGAGRSRWGQPPRRDTAREPARSPEFLDWSEDAGVSIVTLWLLSTDNLARDEGELGELLRIICEAVSLLADQGRWKLAVVGDLALLPEQVSEDLRASVARTASVQGMTVNVAVGYGGRHEITEAVRA